jgi:cytochrome c oxidase subunit IV
MISAVFTVIGFGIQLSQGLSCYKSHKLQIYKGIYMDIPSSKCFDPGSMAADSVHYSGFLIGYMAWSFVICFHMIFFILVTVRIVSLHIPNANLIFTIVVPGLVFYLLKRCAISFAGEYVLATKKDGGTEKDISKRREFYSTLIYFSFFAGEFDALEVTIYIEQSVFFS